MSIGVLLLTHDLVGTSLLKAAERTLAKSPQHVFALPVCNDCEVEKIQQQVQHTLQQLQNDCEQILILTDLYGATPFNVAQQFNNGTTIRVISGLNLSMLLRVLNYQNLEFSELCQKALSGGKDGVIHCEITH